MSIPELSHERMLRREARRGEPALWSASSPQGMIASGHYLATAAGVSMLERGGNAIDAAVAASLALGACEPAGSGLGGMAMMLVHLSAIPRTFTIEGPCRAPARATPKLLRTGSRYRGYRAVAVPTAVSVLSHALSHYGTLSPAEVLAPAIAIAEEGVPLTSLQNMLLKTHRKALQRRNAASVFLAADGRPLPAGRRIRQPTLARTLHRLAVHGFSEFYRGEMAREIADDFEENGGFITSSDLTEWSSPREGVPLVGRLEGDEVCTLGPPGGGLTLVHLLNLWTDLDGFRLNPDSPEGTALLAAAIRQSRRDRKKLRLKLGAEHMGDAEELFELAFTRRAARNVRRTLAEGETSHLSVMDRDGNCVAMTQSLERSFGAAVMTPSLGFLYNGYLRAFKIANRRHPHFLIPGAPARSNAAPTIVLRGGNPVVAVGNTGAERMVSGIFTTLLRLCHRSPFEAVHAPRLHSTPEGLVLLEAARFSTAVLERLREKKFELKALDPYSFEGGGLQLVVREKNAFVGVADPRRDGAAAGPRR